MSEIEKNVFMIPVAEEVRNMSFNQIVELVESMRTRLQTQSQETPIMKEYGEAYTNRSVVLVPFTIEEMRLRLINLTDENGESLPDAESDFYRETIDRDINRDYFLQEAMRQLDNKIINNWTNENHIELITGDTINEILLDIYRNQVNTEVEYTVSVPLSCITKVTIKRRKYDSSADVIEAAKDSIRDTHFENRDLEEWQVNDDIDDNNIEVDKDG